MGDLTSLITRDVSPVAAWRRLRLLPRSVVLLTLLTLRPRRSSTLRSISSTSWASTSRSTTISSRARTPLPSRSSSLNGRRPLVARSSRTSTRQLTLASGSPPITSRKLARTPPSARSSRPSRPQRQEVVEPDENRLPDASRARPGQDRQDRSGDRRYVSVNLLLWEACAVGTQVDR